MSLIKTEQDLSLEELEVKYKPSEKWYGATGKITRFLAEGFLKNSFETCGKENLDENSFQLFLSNHELYKDPVIIHTTIASATNNKRPIPTAGHKDYVFAPFFGPFLVKIYTHPIYSRKDGYIYGSKKITKREKSLDYAAACLLKYGRYLMFPEGSLAFDGKPIKGMRDGKPIKGKLGAAEVAWRVYHNLKENNQLNEKNGDFGIIPSYVTYYPIEVIRNRKNNSKITVRFGKSLYPFFKEQVVDKVHSLRNLFKNEKEKMELKDELYKKFMDKAMDEIGSLVTINMDHIASRVIYDFAIKGYSSIEGKHLEEKLDKIVHAVKNSDNLYYLDHFNKKESVKMAYEDFLRRFRKEGYLTKTDSKLELNLSKIIWEPKEYKKTLLGFLVYETLRSKNRILYNHNLVDHLEEYKDIEREIINN